MKRIIIILFIAFVVNLSGIQFNVDTEKGMDVTVSWDIEEYTINDSDNGRLLQLDSKNNEDLISWNNYGYDLPQVSKLVIVPSGYEPKLNVTDVYTTDIKGIDLDNYRKDSSLLLPEKSVSISEVYKYRGLRFCSIAINPVTKDAKSKSIKIFDRAKINITFSETSEELVSELKLSKSDIQMFEDIVINRNMLEQENIQEDGYFVIIYNCDDSDVIFQNTINKLKNWKEKLGYKVMTQNFHGSNDFSNIKSYLVDGYNNWDMPPKWICLVGDTDACIIPTDYENFSFSMVAGDYQYTLLEEDDNFPDAYIGRLPIRSSSELMAVVNKIIGYENSQFSPDSSYLSNSLLVGDPTDSGVGTIVATDYIKDYIETYDPNHTVDQYTSGSFVNQMTTSINTGISTLYYRGFAGISGFDIDEVNSLYNIKKPFFGAFITCHTNVFNDYYTPASVCEKLVTTGSAASPKGAIGTIGSSSETHTCTNNLLIEAIAEAMYLKDLNAMGEALHYAKLQMVRNYPGDPNQLTSQYLQCMNLMGDPSVRIQRSALKSLEVESLTENMYLTDDYLSFRIIDTDTQNPIEGAKVSLNSSTTIINDVSDNQGYVTFEIANIDENELYLLVYKDEYTTLSHSFVLSTDSSDYDFTFQQASPLICGGTEFALTTNFMNYSQNDIENATIRLYGDNIAQEVVINDVQIPAIESGDSDFLISDINIALDNNVRYEERVKFFYEITANNVNLTYPIVVQDNSFELEITDKVTNNAGYISQAVETELSLYLNACVTNSFSDLQVELVEDHGIISISNPVQTLSLTEGTEELVFDFNFDCAPSAIPGTILPLNLRITDPDSNLERNYPFNLQIYNNWLDYPTGPDNFGYLCYSSMDADELAPSYQWIDIDPSSLEDSNVLDVLDNSYDGGGDYETISLPFEFRYYGETFDQLTICSNGMVIVGETANIDWMNSAIPGPGAPHGMIAPFWDDLVYPYASTDVFYYHDQANDRFIVQWDAKLRYNGSAEKFQLVILNSDEDNHQFLFNYQTINNVDMGSYDGFYVHHGEYATVGITSPDGNDGIQYTYSNRYPSTAHAIQNDFSLLFTPILTEFTPNAEEDVELASSQLIGNYPNPFNPETTISFNLANDSIAKLAIYNVKGQLVKTLINDTLTKGNHKLVWNGRDNKNKKVSSGIYYYKLSTDNYKSTKKMILMK